MKQSIMDLIDAACSRLDVSRTEFLACAASVLLGGAFLVYTWYIVSIFA